MANAAELTTQTVNGRRDAVEPLSVPRRRRRRSRSGGLGYAPRAGSLFLSPPKHARRRRRRGPSLRAVLMTVVILAGLGAGAYALVRNQLDDDERRPAVVAFVNAWARGDYDAYELGRLMAGVREDA